MPSSMPSQPGAVACRLPELFPRFTARFGRRRCVARPCWRALPRHSTSNYAGAARVCRPFFVFGQLMGVTGIYFTAQVLASTGAAPHRTGRAPQAPCTGPLPPQGWWFGRLLTSFEREMRAPGLFWPEWFYRLTLLAGLLHPEHRDALHLLGCLQPLLADRWFAYGCGAVVCVCVLGGGTSAAWLFFPMACRCRRPALRCHLPGDHT